MLRKFFAKRLGDSSDSVSMLPPDDPAGPIKYKTLRLNLMVIMLAVSLLPLLTVALISHMEARNAMEEEALAPLRAMVNKTKYSFEIFLAERKSAISFIASVYDLEELADQQNLEKIFSIMCKEFGGFVDLGLIDSKGIQVSYVGPYDLKGKKYDEQDWFQRVMIKGENISDVFMGHRRFPHFIIAVKRPVGQGESWILRATINTEMFDGLIASMGLDKQSDALVLNREGILQTDSRFFGKTLSQFPFGFPAPRTEAESISVTDPSGREMVLVSASIPGTPFVLMMVKPHKAALQAWERLKSKMMAILLVSLLVIVASIYTICTRLVQRFKTSDLRREAALHNMEHANKLASIGRLAAGVAHEINNPMAIINEKAGLMEDLVGMMQEDMPHKERFLQLIRSIIQSVERCSAITHRLLGFARRMDMKMEMVNVNNILVEVAGFLEQEAIHRNIDMKMNLMEDLPRIESDQGQLQQVFLNIMNNAFEAVEAGGKVRIQSYQPDSKSVSISIEDNGCGISDEVRERIFEPFYTTRGQSGTGLGLSITYGLVRKLGGTIDLTSHVGSGSKFTINLPLKQPVRR